LFEDRDLRTVHVAVTDEECSAGECGEAGPDEPGALAVDAGWFARFGECFVVAACVTHQISPGSTVCFARKLARPGRGRSVRARSSSFASHWCSPRVTAAITWQT